MHGTKVARNQAKAAATKPKKQKKAKAQTTDAEAAAKVKRKKVTEQQPLSTQKTVAKQMAVAKAQLQVKALPAIEALNTEYAAKSTQAFKKSPFHYHQVPPQNADMILMGDTKARRHNDEMIKYIDSPLLMVTDPVLRETIRQEENKALKADRIRQEKITQHILSTLTSNQKVKAMIKEGASNKQILNAMYNLLPRIMPTRSLRHNVDQLDWLGQIRHRWQNEIEPNGHDVEDSSDADTLPQQRPFTRDEMHRLLQDVEESKYIESDVEEALFAPAAAMGDLKRELQAIEIDTQLRFVLKNHQGEGVPPESFDYRTMRRNFKLLLGSQQTQSESGLSEPAIEKDKSLEEFKLSLERHDGSPNQLSETLQHSVLSTRHRREERIGAPYLFGSHAGAMDAQDFLLPATITNAGLGLMPPMFDVLQLPVHYIHDTSGKEERIDMFNDSKAPFQSRFDIACAVVLNRIMGPGGRDIPTYLTDTVDAEVKLQAHPKYRVAQLAMLKDLKAGTNTAVESIQALMKDGYHPQDVMKRLVKHLDDAFTSINEGDSRVICFDDDANLTDPATASVIFTGEDINRLKEYHEFIHKSMKTAKVLNETQKFTNGENADTIAVANRQDLAADENGAAPVDHLKSSLNKVNFETYQVQVDADGTMVTKTRAISSSHPEALVARSQLQASEYGIGSVHRASPVEIDLTNNLGIAVTEPQSSPFGFRPNQKTIYGKQLVADAESLNHLSGGLASREVPATRYTTDGTEITLDPHRATEYTNKEMSGALDNFFNYVKPRIVREQLIADETAELFQPGTHGLTELLQFSIKNDPDYLSEDPSDPAMNSGYENDSEELPDMALKKGVKQRYFDKHSAPLTLKYRGAGLLSAGEKQAIEAELYEKRLAATDTDVEIQLDSFDENFNPSTDDVFDQNERPQIVLEHKIQQDQPRQTLEQLLDNPDLQRGDVNWSPLTNWAVRHARFLLDRLDKIPESRETKFRAFCKEQKLELTDWDSEFNVLIRRVFDGDISDQLTHAARQMTREEQLAALVPILNDWKKVLQHDRSHLLNPTGQTNPVEKAYREDAVNRFTEGFRLARAQIRLTDELERVSKLDDYGYGAVAQGALVGDEAMVKEDAKLGIDFNINLKSKPLNVKVVGTGEAGEVASQSLQVGTIMAPITDISEGGLGKIVSATAPHPVPDASLTHALHKPKYTLFDLFEGRVKIAAGGSNAPAITDFDFRAHYMDKVAKDVEAFNLKYYIRQEFSSFDDLVAAIPDAGKLPEMALKILKAKSQISSNKFVHFKRNETAYEEGDIDPVTGRELKIKSLGVADVDVPITEELLASIQKHHRLMLNDSDKPHQFNIDINSYINALDSNGGDRAAALESVESKMDVVPNDVLTKQLKRYLQAWRARDIEDAAMATGQEHTLTSVKDSDSDASEDASNTHEDIDEAHNIAPINPLDHVAGNDIVTRHFSRSIMGYEMFSSDEFERIAKRAEETGELPAAITASPTAALLYKEWLADKIAQTMVANKWGTIPQPEEVVEDKGDVFARPDQGLGFRHLHRTPNKQYQATMDLPVDGDEMDHLRDKLTKNLLDPMHEDNLDDRVEWFNEPELLQPFDHKILTGAINRWIGGDPFFQYFDNLPPGVKEAEVLRSSFSMIPPRLLDDAIKAREGDETAKRARRRNVLRYNPAFSLHQLRKFRRGLEKYSGIPLYLLDFAEVAYNPHRPFFVHSSKEENHLREMMTEERLRQPARPLIKERPENSDNDTPDISTPITIGGTPASRQAAHVQNHYASLTGTERVRRIQKFKKDLSIAKKDEFDEISEISELEDQEHLIAQDMFQRALDRLLQREHTAFLSSDYDMETLRQQYPEEMRRYEFRADRRERLKKLKDEEAGRRLRRDHTGAVALGAEQIRFTNGFLDVPDTSDADEIAAIQMEDARAEDPEYFKSYDPSGSEYEMAWKNRMNRKMLGIEHETLDLKNDGLENANDPAQFQFAMKPRQVDLGASKSLPVHRIRDFMSSFYDYLGEISRTGAREKTESDFARRVAEIQGRRLRFFNQGFIDSQMPLNHDPLGAKTPSAEWEVFFDRQSEALPVIGRHRQTLRVAAESYLRHRRLVERGLATEDDYKPHAFEIGWTFEHLYGFPYWDDEEERAACKAEYRQFIRQTRPKIVYQGREIGTDDEEYLDIHGRVYRDEDAKQKFLSSLAEPEAVHEAAVSETPSPEGEAIVATPEGTESIDAEGLPALTGDHFDTTIAKSVEAEHIARQKYQGRVRQDGAGVDVAQDEKLHDDLLELEDAQIFALDRQTSRMQRIDRTIWSRGAIFDADESAVNQGEQFGNAAVDAEGIGVASIFHRLSRPDKVHFLMDLIHQREQREFVAARREDIVSTVYGTQRQLLRRLTDELQLVKRAERTAFKRIFALDPQYARELVGRHLLYATGRRHPNDELASPAEINWKVELNYIEEIMWSSANRLNARTGGMFPGAPGVNRAHDKTFFTPPPLIAGEFAPMFVDQNMISSGDEFEEARTRLQYHGNADFVACGVTEWKKMGKKRESLSDQIHHDDDTKAVFNSRTWVDDGMARQAIEMINDDFSDFAFTSDMEQGLIDNNIAQLSLDTATNMAFASAISTHRQRLDLRRSKIEAEHPLFMGTFDPNVDWKGGDFYGIEPTKVLADGSIEGKYTALRHRLKSLMSSKRDLNLSEANGWEGLFADDTNIQDPTQENPNQKVQDLLQGLNSMLRRAERINPLSPGHIFPVGEEKRSAIIPHNTADVEAFHSKVMAHLDAPFDTDGSITANVKAATSKKLDSAVHKAQEMRAKADTDILGHVMIPSKFASVDVKKVLAEDPEMEAAVLAQQAFQRFLGANTILQANALTLRMADAIDDTNAAIISEIGTDLLSQQTIDQITLSVLGGKGGAPIIPTTDEFIDPFIRSPAEIIGGLLALQPQKGKKHLNKPQVYNTARSVKQEQEDLAKIEAGEMTEWTEVEVFESSEDIEKVDADAPAYARFARAVQTLKNFTSPALLDKIDLYDNEIAPGQTSAVDHPGLAGKKEKVVFDQFDPALHLTEVFGSKYELSPALAKGRSFKSNPVVARYPQLQASFDEMQAKIDAEDGSEVHLVYAPKGQQPSVKALAIPDHANDHQVRILKKLDDPSIDRPVFQQLRKTSRDELAPFLPSFMKQAKRKNVALTWTNDDNEIVTYAPQDAANPLQVVNASVDDAQALRPANVKSEIQKIQRQKYITAKEAIALGLDPNVYEGMLTRVQKTFVNDRLDELFSQSEWKEDPVFTSNKYIRSLFMFTGLRKLEADPKIGASMLRSMLHGADIQDETTLYSDMNIKSFYKYIRTIEKQDKLLRMGVSDAQYEMVNSGADLTDEKNNPMGALKRSGQERTNSPLLDLIRDIVHHAEAYGEIEKGNDAPKFQMPQYNPVRTIKKGGKHQRFEEEYSGNESDFENVNVVTVDNHELTTQPNKFDEEFNIMHAAMIKTKKSLNGLSIEEVDQIFAVADKQPPVLRKVLVDLLREYLSVYPQSSAVIPALHVESFLNKDQNHTAHPLRNLQVMGANDQEAFIDQANPRGVFTLEEIDLSLVDMKKRFNMEHGNALPAEDLAAFNKILLDCAREGRIYYPKPKMHEIKVQDDGALADGTIGFDVTNLAIGKLDQFKPEDLRYSSDTVTIDTFNRIMSMPPQKLQTFMLYSSYIQKQSAAIAHRSFMTQLMSDIRAVRPIDQESIADTGDAVHVRDMYKNRTQFDNYTMAPNGYIRLNENYLTDDSAIFGVVQRAKYGRVKGKDNGHVAWDVDPETEDPAYNFRVLDSDVETYGPQTKEIIKDFYRDVVQQKPVDIMSDLGDLSGIELDRNDILEEIPKGDRPEDADLGRRFLNIQHWLADPLSPRQIKIMRQMYEERKLEAYWQGTMSPFDSATVYNNLRLADKMIDADTHLDHDRELARLHREIVVGVVREVMDDQDITMHSLEYDSYNVEPDFLPTYTHYDHVNVFAARRFSPYTTLPLSESNIPPMIGIEQQRNIYNLHLLDPVTFHPRWLARRLNVSYSQCIAILKTYDFRHRLNMHETLIGTDAEIDDGIDNIDDSPLNPDFASIDLKLPNPPEVQLSQMDEEYLYSRFAPNLIGRVSWTKKREREIERTDPGFRNVLGSQDMFGGDAVAKYVDGLENQLTKRFMEEERILDAIEQAAFARFGPIHWGASKVGELHRPPKLPREIISSSLQPPMRNNWALTTLDEANRATYGIMVRDRDGYLRHPTYREFRAIRTREKDRRTPFHWRRHHILGKLPEISSLFVDQVTQIKADFDAKTNLAKDMRTGYDLNFVKQVDYTPLAFEEDVKLQGSSEDPEAFNKSWDKLQDNIELSSRLDDTTIRARDWLSDFNNGSREKGLENVTEQEEALDNLYKLPLQGAPTPTGGLTPIQRVARYRIAAMMKGKSHADQASDNDEQVLIMDAFEPADLSELEIPQVPPELAEGEQWSPEHLQFFSVATQEDVDQWVSGDAKQRRKVSNKILINHMQTRHPHIFKGMTEFITPDADASEDVHPHTQMKDTITMKNIMARKAAESDAKYSPSMNTVDTASKEQLKDLALIKKGLRPTPEMFHYQRILARRGDLITEFAMPAQTQSSGSDSSHSEDSRPSDPTDEWSEPSNPKNKELFKFYNAIRHDSRRLNKFVKNAHRPTVSSQEESEAQLEVNSSNSDPEGFSSLSEGEMEHARKSLIGEPVSGDDNNNNNDDDDDDDDGPVSGEDVGRAEELRGAYGDFVKSEKAKIVKAKNVELLKKKRQQQDEATPLAVAGKETPEQRSQRYKAELTAARYLDPEFQTNIYQREDQSLNQFLPTDDLKQYLTRAEQELEHMANGPRGLKKVSYIATVDPIRTSLGKTYYINQGDEARRYAREFNSNKSQVPISMEEMESRDRWANDKVHRLYAADFKGVVDSDNDQFYSTLKDIEKGMAEEEAEIAAEQQEFSSEVSEFASKSSSYDDGSDHLPEPDNSRASIHPHGVYAAPHHKRDVSEDAFYDNHHQGVDMYQQTYGVPRDRLTTAQMSQITDIRSSMNELRTAKLQSYAKSIRQGEKQKYKTLRKHLYDPKQEFTQSAHITRFPSLSNVVDNDPALAEYLKSIDSIPEKKPEPNPYGH